MMNKTFFLIAFKEGHGILILKKKALERWELPKIASSKEKPLSELAEEFMHKHFRANHRILGQSSVMDSYEWPKELQSITGKEGGEHRFIFLELTGKADKSCLKSDEYSSYDFVDYDLLIQKVVFKNHKKVLRDVLDDLNKKRRLKDRGVGNSGI